MTGNYKKIAEKRAFSYKIYSVDIFHILVLQEYWVLMECRIPLQPVLGEGGVRIVAHSIKISSYEQTQENRVCCFLKL